MTDMLQDPFALFARWLQEAEASEPNDPNAMALATVDADGQPSVRMVLLKGHGAENGSRGGFVFYTNRESRKGAALEAHPRAALLFHWKSLRRQVRIEGAVERVDDALSDAYFTSRTRDSQIGAWASDQSRPMKNRAEFLARIAKYAAKYAIGPVPRPPHWGGYRVVPERIEFWTDRKSRLHERSIYLRDDSAESGWRTEIIYP